MPSASDPGSTGARGASPPSMLRESRSADDPWIETEEPPVLAVPETPVAAPRQHADDDFAIRVDDLSLVYRTALESRPTLRSSVRRIGRRQRMVREIHALDGVSFSVDHGKVLGVVGANGAGKSTLMRTVAGILPPTSGRVEVHGRVSTLLALGIGFNRDLTGRQNVVLGGLASGLRRDQLKAKYEQIVAFAELGEFMDMPMRTYSSGMYGRLAFSVAVNLDPDILLIDEALSVGDARFRKKSFRKMRQLCRQAKTIVLVSHSMASIRTLCDEAIWMHDGKLRMAGDPDSVIAAYTDFLEVNEDDPESEDDV